MYDKQKDVIRQPVYLRICRNKPNSLVIADFTVICSTNGAIVQIDATTYVGMQQHGGLYILVKKCTKLKGSVTKHQDCSSDNAPTSRLVSTKKKTRLQLYPQQ